MAAVAMCFVQYEAILAIKMTKLNVHSVISLSKKRVSLSKKKTSDECRLPYH